MGWEKDLLTWSPRFVDGCLELPSAPGLGADLNLEVVEAHPYHAEGDISLWDTDWHYRREPRAEE